MLSPGGQRKGSWVRQRTKLSPTARKDPQTGRGRDKKTLSSWDLGEVCGYSVDRMVEGEGRYPVSGPIGYSVDRMVEGEGRIPGLWSHWPLSPLLLPLLMGLLPRIRGLRTSSRRALASS